MANECGNVGEHPGNCQRNAFAHIADDSHRLTVLVADALQERFEVFGVFRWQLPVFQYDFTHSVKHADQVRAGSFAGTVQVEDVASPQPHG